MFRKIALAIKANVNDWIDRNLENYITWAWIIFVVVATLGCTAINIYLVVKTLLK